MCFNEVILTEFLVVLYADHVRFNPYIEFYGTTRVTPDRVFQNAGMCTILLGVCVARYIGSGVAYGIF